MSCRLAYREGLKNSGEPFALVSQSVIYSEKEDSWCDNLTAEDSECGLLNYLMLWQLMVACPNIVRSDS